MTISKANNKQPGVRTFYVTGDSGAQYVVQYVRRSGQRRFFCNCPDFTFRQVMRKRHCKHCREVACRMRPLRAAGKMDPNPWLGTNFVENHILGRVAS